MQGYVQEKISEFGTGYKKPALIAIGIGVIALLLHYAIGWGMIWVYLGAICVALGLYGLSSYYRIGKSPEKKKQLLYQEFSRFGDPNQIIDSVNAEVAAGIQEKPDPSSILNATLDALKNGRTPLFPAFYTAKNDIITPSWVVSDCPNIICLSRLDDLFLIYLEVVSHEFVSHKLQLQSQTIAQSITWNCVFVDGTEFSIFPNKTLQGFNEACAPILAAVPWVYVQNEEIMENIQQMSVEQKKERLKARKEALIKIVQGKTPSDSDEKAGLEWNLSYARGESTNIPGIGLL